MPFPTLAGPALLSPMAGVTDVAFRALCKRYGAAMTYTEFVSSAALVRNNAKTRDLLVTDPSEKPVAVQLFGANEEEIVAAAKLVEEQFDVIDMNCGCPVHKVIKTGAGSALLNDPEKVGRLVKRVVEAVSKPVTIKIRAGIDGTRINAVEVAKAAEKAGAAAVAVHGRTQRQGYRGLADWAVVKAVKAAVRIPVIGNGDVFSAEEFMEKWRYSGCDYIMIARGAIGNPGIFAEIERKVKKEDNNIKNNENTNKKETNTFSNNKNNSEYFFASASLADKYAIPFAQLKAQAMRFTKGLEGGTRRREAITQARNAAELRELMKGV